jgi:hypothetical protein
MILGSANATLAFAICAVGLVSARVTGATQSAAFQQGLQAPEPGRGHARGLGLCPGGPRLGAPVYLHAVKPDRIASVPTTRTDESGRWVALNLEPGSYVAWTFTPGTMTAAYRLTEVREVTAGQVTNFGTQESG